MRKIETFAILDRDIAEQKVAFECVKSMWEKNGHRITDGKKFAEWLHTYCYWSSLLELQTRLNQLLK